MKKMAFIILLIGLFSITLGFTPNPTRVDYTTLWKELNNVGVKWPEIAFAQAVLESGHFKSVVYKSNNNLFGMRLPGKRETVALGKKMGYATYTSWQESVYDYKLYQDYILEKRKIDSKEEYIGYIKRTYAESSNYIQLLRKIMKDFSYIVS
jgi:uncharacterized FlgJ-related protein